jgi:anthranilate synthase component 2
LLVDNFDSFTFNLLHSLEKNEHVKVTVVRNNCLLNLDASEFKQIVLSPGPGLPSEAGELMPFIEKHYKEKSFLGICLGHQALGQFFNANLKNLPNVLHGVQLETKIIETSKLFNKLPSSILTGHYHSWVLDELNFPSCLKITAQNALGGVMAFEHHNLAIAGIQFHPESVLTPDGDQIIQNWLNK